MRPAFGLGSGIIYEAATLQARDRRHPCKLEKLIVAMTEAPARRSLGGEIMGEIRVVRPSGKAKPFRKSGGRAADHRRPDRG
jgi:hypothetical protein